MQLTLIKKSKIFTLILPNKIAGRHWIYENDIEKNKIDVLSVEGIDDNWILQSNKKNILIDDNGKNIKSIKIEPLCIYNIFKVDTKETMLLYTEPTTLDRTKFIKYALPQNGEICIGRNDCSDIVYDNKLVSAKPHHAKLIIKDGKVSVKDLDSTNGTFVNGSKVNDFILNPGDVIYILGLKIIIAKELFCINNPDLKVKVSDELLAYQISKTLENVDEDGDGDGIYQNSEDFFYRSPRFKQEIKQYVLEIDPPPSKAKKDETPAILLLGPSLTMGMASVVTAMSTITNNMNNNNGMRMAVPTLVMSCSMLLGTVLWPILSKKYQNLLKNKNEKKRQKKYTDYISLVKKDIQNQREKQKEILEMNYLPLNNYIDRIENVKRNLWERTNAHNDFLNIRFGRGNINMYCNISCSPRKFSLENDNLFNLMYEVYEEPRKIEDVPITYSLIQDYISGIVGNRDEVIEFVEGIILQIAALHSYDEVKFIFIYDENEEEKWKFVKWLPHVWNENRTMRYVATDFDDVKELSNEVEKIINNRLEKNISDAQNIVPYYIIFSASRKLGQKAEMISMLLNKQQNIGFSLIALYDQLRYLPKECSRVIDFNLNGSKIYDRNDTSSKIIDFIPDIYQNIDYEKEAIKLANIKLDISSQRFTLPKMITFLEMYNVGKIEHLNILSRWKNNNPVNSLKAPVGVDKTGELFYLDLHERYHGPHGLIAGMTGSGKSEFIITFILSLAINYNPNEIAFVLIDYKGGGLAGAFENDICRLPHLAGTITNLDGASIKRSLISIQSELRRRQAIFNEARKATNEGTMDIYKYQKFYRDGIVKEPVQHLFIICDEFAELKTQEPEFMQQLTSAARIGRSLGVHLILATQKPAGVVDDQIWSNSRFRVCLKVQEKSDSMDMIKRSDAAELAETGRFYLQVGFNEFFDMGQSAWSGAPYYPSNKVQKKKDYSVQVIDNIGRIVKEAKIADSVPKVKTNKKQIVEINKYLAQIANEENIHIHKLWLDPISAFIYVDSLKKKYNIKVENPADIRAVIGEYDDPFNQKQHILTLDISDGGNVLVYGSTGNGKTTMITSLVYSIIKDYTPENINIYILDFSSETLRAFSKAPHVGDVVCANDSEKIFNLVKMLNKELEQRKEKFAEYGGDFKSYCSESGKVVPVILVIINNFSGLIETYEDIENELIFLTREGSKYGIDFIISAITTNAVRYKMIQNFKQTYVLQMNEKTDYSAVLGSIGGVYPSKIKGRGIFKKNNNTYEFQTAYAFEHHGNIFTLVRKVCKQFENESHMFAKSIPVLPSIVTKEFFNDEIISIESIPIGIDKDTLEVSKYDFANKYVHLVASQETSNCKYYLQGLAEIMSINNTIEVNVFDSNNSFVKVENNIYKYYSDKLIERNKELFDIVVERFQNNKKLRSEGKAIDEYQRKVYIISDFSEYYNALDNDGKDKFKLLLEKGSVDVSISIIICMTSTAYSTYSYEKWCKKHLSLGNGIWIGNGIRDQYMLKINSPSRELRKEISNDFGYDIQVGRCKCIKLIASLKNNLESDYNG